MRAWTLAFSSAVILFGFVPRVPPLPLIICCLSLGLALHWRRRTQLPAAFMLGGGWLLLYAHQSVGALWPAELEGVDVWAQGVVWNLPQQAERSLRFEFRIEKFCAQQRVQECDFNALPRTNQKVLVNLYQPLPVVPGQRWQLQLRLQRPHGFANPGGFDYEAWLMQNRIRATGYVREHASNVLLADTTQRQFMRWRHQLVQRLTQVEGLHYPHLMRALTLGDHTGISEAEWKLFSQTGTNHLIVISGMHIALIALVLYRLGWWLATRSTWLMLRWPAPQVAAAFALVGAWCYSGLAGFSLPVQRAFVMAALLFAGRLLRRQTSPIDALCLALALILVLDPLAPQNAGFWLSYCAVAVLLLMLQRPAAGESPGRPAWILRCWRVLLLEWKTQWRVFFALLPILLLFFQQVSPLAPLINMPAIPYVGILVVPLALVSITLLWLWPAAGAALSWVVDSLLRGFMLALERYVALTPFDLVTLPALPMTAMALVCLLIVAALFLPRASLRLAAMALVPAVFTLWPRQEIAEGKLRVAVLDVGQGLAVVISTRQHHLLYDAGPYFSARFDAGNDVVVPYLRQRNIRRLDVVMISHADGDHAGGLAGVATEFPDARYLGSEPSAFPVPGEFCARGEAWQWDGVGFRVLHPEARAAYSRNDASCVLEITSGDSVILLPGDIERSAERQLLGAASLREATLLLAPHHGSASSSTPAFVAAVRPDAVVYASGYRNRFGHPRPAVRERYAAAGSQEYLTAQSGEVEFDIGPSGIEAVREWRRERRRFWARPG